MQLQKKKIFKFKNNQKSSLSVYSYFRQALLEPLRKGFAYDVMELQMSIEDDRKPVGNSKIDDISSLIQLYMIAVQLLEGLQDTRFKFFSRKLSSLMLKKQVVTQLHAGKNGVKNDLMLMSPKNKQEKRKQHQIQLFYNKDQVQKSKVRELVNNAESKIKNYEGIINNHLKQQQEKIKERLQLRKLKSQTGSIKNLDLNEIQAKYKTQFKAKQPQMPNKETKNFEIFDDQPTSKSKNLVTTSKHENFL